MVVAPEIYEMFFMKGLVLSGGYGTRLRPLTYSQQKQLIPIANKPILFYALEDLINSGVKKLGIVLGPNREQVISAVKSVDWDAEIEFIYQGEPKGIAHAILVSEIFLGKDDFVLYLGDNILAGGIKEHLKKFLQERPDCSLMLAEVEKPERFGVVELNPDMSIKRIVEKPKIPPSNLAQVGIWFFTSSIMDACKNIKPSWRNELEISDAIQWLIDKGKKISWTRVDGWWKDTGKPEDIIEANRLVLDGIKYSLDGKLNNSKVLGRVIIEEDTEINNSIIKGPCTIGKKCMIENAYIGPYTSIGNNCIIRDREIEDSIVMDNSEINGKGRIIESLIGKNVKIMKKGLIPNGSRFVIGDGSEVDE